MFIMNKHSLLHFLKVLLNKIHQIHKTQFFYISLYFSSLVTVGFFAVGVEHCIFSSDNTKLLQQFSLMEFTAVWKWPFSKYQ
jgi:hypothetical protein